jgi:putative FmdB family regulatory protein
MPLYEYQCRACGQRFEIIQKFSDPPAGTCRVCGKGPVERLLSSPAIQFKGTGWYITDYSQKGKPASDSASGGDKGDTGDKGDRQDGAADKTAAGKSGEKAASTESTKPATAAKTDS